MPVKVKAIENGVVKRLPIKINNHHVIEIQFKKKKGQYTREEVLAKSKKIQERYKTKLRGQMLVTIHFDFGWRNGNVTDLNEEPSLFDLSDYYQDDIPDAWKNKVWKQDKFPEFRIYLLPSKRLAGGCDSKYNDCLWKCLRDAFNGQDFLPGVINKPYKLKKMLGLDRCDKVPVSKLPIIEDKVKIKINVLGDTIYNSDKQYPREMDLKLSNEHYKLKPLKNRDLLRSVTKGHERKPLIYDKQDGKIHTYNGKKMGTITIDEFLKMKNRPFSCKYVLIPLGKHESFEKKYEEWTEIADQLLEETNGLINMYECGKDKHAAKKLFHLKSKSVRQPEPIEQDEAAWLMDASMGGLIWADKGAEIKNACKYDANSRYSSIMCRDKYPTKRGKFVHLKNLPENPEYGIYHCVIHKADPKRNVNKYFKYNRKNKYTHRDIGMARRLNLKVDLVQDGQVNALLYSEECLVGGHIMFKPFVHYLYPLKQKKLKGAKLLLNILWGSLCERNTKTRQTNLGDIDLVNVDLVSIEPTAGGHHWVEYVPRDEYYVTDYARIGPFLTAIGRSMLSGLVQKYGDRVKQFHTDGFIVDGEIPDLKLSKDLGWLNQEREGGSLQSNQRLQAGVDLV